MPPELRQFEVLSLSTVACTGARLVVCTGCLHENSGADFRYIFVPLGDVSMLVANFSDTLGTACSSERTSSKFPFI